MELPEELQLPQFTLPGQSSVKYAIQYPECPFQSKNYVPPEPDYPNGDFLSVKHYEWNLFADTIQAILNLADGCRAAPFFSPCRKVIFERLHKKVLKFALFLIRDEPNIHLEGPRNIGDVSPTDVMKMLKIIYAKTVIDCSFVISPMAYGIELRNEPDLEEAAGIYENSLAKASYDRGNAALKLLLEEYAKGEDNIPDGDDRGIPSEDAIDVLVLGGRPSPVLRPIRIRMD